MTSRLIESLATTESLAGCFSDSAVLAAMLRFEVALARAQSAAGLMEPAVAARIAGAADARDFNAAAIAREARSSATVAIPFVAALTARVQAVDERAARFVHFGATSQDVIDTAFVLCLARAHQHLVADHARLLRALVALSDAHARTAMLGRTLLQPATPTTFGLKVAGWAAGLARAGGQWQAAHDRAMVVQFGGAAGTLASLGASAEPVESALAAELGLSRPDAPWHAHRDRIVTLASAMAVYVGELGKMATDLALLMQYEVAEAFEPGGGSSTMPHKRNPSGCAIILAAATRVPHLTASLLSSMTQAHERGVGGWHAEAPTMATLVQAFGSALAAAADVIDGLSVDPARMRANLDATRGVIFAERVTLLLTPGLGREAASRLVTAAVAETQHSGRTFGQVVAATPAIVTHLRSEDLSSIDEPGAYLGAADAFRARLLATARAAFTS